MARKRRFEHSLFLTTILVAACSGGEDATQTDTVGTGGSVTGSGGAGGSSGAFGSGGQATGGQATGGQATGGQATGGQATGGQATGGQATGGQGTGGQGTGGQATGGQGGQGGQATGGQGTGGSSDGGAPSGGTAGVGEPGDYPIGNPPVPSAACGTQTTVTTGERTINSTNQDRVYYIDVPNNYDMNQPYRLFYISHWIGSRYQDMVNNNFYGLKTLAEAAGEPAIFVAPSSDGSTWQEKDHALFDDLLAFVKENLCIDTSRVFATGFSFGGMITYSLSTNHQQDIRAAVGIAPANYNIWLPEKTREPIAWMQTTGMGDTTCPWDQNGSTNGAKYIAEEKAEDNHCTIPSEIPTWQSGDHLCYDYEECDANHPAKVCTFDGGHQAESSDPGSNVNWIPQVSWEFFTQF
jgi:poly(3-hydroxybutyrate) depolymerase